MNTSQDTLRQMTVNHQKSVRFFLENEMFWLFLFGDVVWSRRACHSL